MKIGLRGGHSPNCKGAIGLIDEQAEVRKIYNELAPMLQAVGHTVVVFFSRNVLRKSSTCRQH